jgi:hypothetical protein
MMKSCFFRFILYHVINSNGWAKFSLNCFFLCAYDAGERQLLNSALIYGQTVPVFVV